MSLHNIAFRAEFVPVLIDGTKTQTRRLMTDSEINALKWVVGVIDNEAAGSSEDVDLHWGTVINDEGLDPERQWYAERTAQPEAGCVPLGRRYGPPGTLIDLDINPAAAYWGSQITIEVVSVRIQRLQEITAADAAAEGITLGIGCPDHPIGFRRIWGALYRGELYAWDRNPWVWVIEFKRVEP